MIFCDKVYEDVLFIIQKVAVKIYVLYYTIASDNWVYAVLALSRTSRHESSSISVSNFSCTPSSFKQLQRFNKFSFESSISFHVQLTNAHVAAILTLASS